MAICSIAIRGLYGHIRDGRIVSETRISATALGTPPTRSAIALRPPNTLRSGGVRSFSATHSNLNVSGLAKAFFYAGARSLLVSHWSVPSQATVKLITGAFDALKADPTIGRAEALRRAEMAMMDRSNPPEFSHPLASAPFVLAGEGGAGR